MAREDYRNGEGYYDPTAGEAIQSADQQIRRGEIYYIGIPFATGSEMQKDRPGIVVSCKKLNDTSPCVTVVFCSGSEKRDLPEHVTIRSTPQKSTALCEQIFTVDKSRLGRRMGCCTSAEMNAIDIAIMVGLNLGGNGLASAKKSDLQSACTAISAAPFQKVECAPPSEAVDPKELVRLEAQLETYRGLYERLLDRVTLGGRVSA